MPPLRSEGQPVTVSCAEGDTGFIYEGACPSSIKIIEMSHMPDIPVKMMMNVGNPDRAFAFAATPNAGVGLARLEFIINNMIGIHPKALLEYDQLPADLKARIAPRIAAYPSPSGVLRHQAGGGHRHSGAPPSRPIPSSCACRTSSPTNTPT